MGGIRPSAAAGTFYPADARGLRAMVERYVAAADGGRTAGTPKAVIAPHAGLVYSGPVAGHAFAALGREAARIRRVVVIGPAHFVPFRGLAVPSADAFRTPLGDVRVLLEQLAEPDRAREPAGAGADDQDTDVDPLVRGVGRPGDHLAGRERRREVGRPDRRHSVGGAAHRPRAPGPPPGTARLRPQGETRGRP